MSQLNVNTIKNRTGVGGISLPHGANSAGVITATSLDSRELIGDVNVGGAVTISGNLTVDGTQTIINTSSLEVEDKTVGVGSTSNPSDASANGAGLVVYGTTEKSLTWGTSGYKWTLAGGGLQAQDVSVTGVVTAASFKGDGSTLSGIDAAPVFSATASGTIANGKTVVLNADATVSAATTSEVAAATGSLQAVPMASNIYTDPDDCVWLSNTKYISFWKQWNNNNGIYGQVGTVSGTTITFGSVTQVATDSTSWSWIRCDYDKVNEVVIAFVGSSSAKVFGMTVSGTTITESSTVAGTGENCNAGDIKSDQKGGFMVCYIRSANDQYIRAGTYNSSGDMTWGSASGGDNGYATQTYRMCNLAYSPDDDRWMVAWQKASGTYQTRYSVATRSGTSASGTTPTGYNAGAGANCIFYNSKDKYFVALNRKSGSGAQTLRTLTIDPGGTGFTVGTTIDTFDDQDQDDFMAGAYSKASGKGYCFFHDTEGTASMRLLTITLPALPTGTPTKTAESVGTASDIAKMGGLACSDDGKVLTQQRGGGTPYYNYNRIKQENIITTNLTTTNFIGFSADNYTNGQTVKIKTVGNTDANLSGLITATKYYVQRGGELGVSAGDPSVYAGLALNSTTIAIKLPLG
jgi:hypothetical protein